MKITREDGIEEEYVLLLEEALPKLGLPLSSNRLDEFRGGEQFIGAADVLRMCVERGIDVTEEALVPVEEDAILFADDPWETARHYYAQIVGHIAVIRARRAVGTT
ncbi:hypothetical protein GZ998_06620 [Actinomyces sp. 594]|uniref:hypothetical protein n=1 Tax=Actinomyces sp. 594 TaxID=2057793 RepID=UPI001C57062B|nr:hypothetical protein [Actinomyces sp. 594]MBW3069178.1 hypothetical protein [Actinomyces sp. 594]